MKVKIYYKNPLMDIEIHTCDMWGIDQQNSLLKLYKKNKKGIMLCNMFVRLTEIRKVEII